MDKKDEHLQWPSYREKREAEYRLFERVEKESEILIHFYVREIHLSVTKHDIHDKLMRALKEYGEVRDLTFIKGKN